MQTAHVAHEMVFFGAGEEHTIDAIKCEDNAIQTVEFNLAQQLASPKSTIEMIAAKFIQLSV